MTSFRHIWNIKRQFLYTNLLNVIQDCSCKDVINIYYRLISLQPCHKKCDTSGGNGTRRSNDQKAKGLIQLSPLPKKERKHLENSSTQQVYINQILSFEFCLILLLPRCFIVLIQEFIGWVKFVSGKSFTKPNLPN